MKYFLAKGFIAALFILHSLSSATATPLLSTERQLHVADEYWSKIMEGKNDEAVHLLSDPNQLHHLSSFKFSADEIQTYINKDNKVFTTAKRHCYKDVSFETVMVNVNGVYKIDHRATFKHLIKEALKNREPIEQYCYDFINQNLTGRLNGEQWSFEKADIREVTTSERPNLDISLYSEDCDTENKSKCTEPQILLNFPIDDAGGNFNGQNNITIHTPPHYNEIISTGSYRITHLSNDKTKIEITFEEDADNHLKGFIILNQKDGSK